MKTEKEIQDMIYAIEESAQDHHLLLNTPLVRDMILSNYETCLRLLNWVLEEPIPTCSETADKVEKNDGTSN